MIEVNIMGQVGIPQAATIARRVKKVKNIFLLMKLVMYINSGDAKDRYKPMTIPILGFVYSVILDFDGNILVIKKDIAIYPKKLNKAIITPLIMNFVGTLVSTFL